MSYDSAIPITMEYNSFAEESNQSGDGVQFYIRHARSELLSRSTVHPRVCSQIPWYVRGRCSFSALLHSPLKYTFDSRQFNSALPCNMRLIILNKTSFICLV